MPYIEGVHQLPKLRWRFRPELSVSLVLIRIFSLLMLNIILPFGWIPAEDRYSRACPWEWILSRGGKIRCSLHYKTGQRAVAWGLFFCGVLWTATVSPERSFLSLSTSLPRSLPRMGGPGGISIQTVIRLSGQKEAVFSCPPRMINFRKYIERMFVNTFYQQNITEYREFKMGKSKLG